jgi:hypothetical protein
MADKYRGIRGEEYRRAMEKRNSHLMTSRPLDPNLLFIQIDASHGPMVINILKTIMPRTTTMPNKKLHAAVNELYVKVQEALEVREYIVGSKLDMEV